MSSPLQRLIQENNLQPGQVIRNGNTLLCRDPQLPPKYFVHYYNHFDFISELLDRVDKLEEKIRQMEREVK